MTENVVTRFAPSPTGYLHIGGARTALFSWLYARGRSGRFLLRIEDTDRARHNEAAVQAIYDGLAWLGLDWDGEAVSQYARRERHAEVAHDLLRVGAAYRCYMTASEIEAAREAALGAKVRFESPWREADPKVAPDAPYTIRFRAPRDGQTLVADAVQGDVRFPNSALDDLILLRSDFVPTYNLAVVVDDHDMGVTHVIRGDDHLNNAARQQQIYTALGWSVPVFAHVPLIHGADGAKLSKRHGALGVDAYRDDGILPEALANYLLRLGWSHGDDEIIPRARAIEWFDLTGVNRAPSRLDLDKLRSVNARTIGAMDPSMLATRAAAFLSDPALFDQASFRASLVRAAPFIRSRMVTLKDINDAAAFLIAQRPLTIAGKAAAPLAREGARDLLGALARHLDDGDVWSAPASLEASLQAFAAGQGVAFGDIAPLMRAALTGGLPAPALSEVLYALGREEALGRISDRIQGS